MTPNEPTARLGSRVVTEAEVRAYCAAVGLPYPLPGGSEDGTELDNDGRPTRTGHGVRLSPRSRRLGYVARTRRSAGSGVAPMRATPPRTAPLTVRDARRRERIHMAGQWAIVFAVVLGITILGLWGSWDRQPMGERRTPAQEGMER